MKPTRLINGRGNFQLCHEKRPKLERSGFHLASGALQLQQVHVSEGVLRWLSQSATLKSYVLLLRMFLSECKKAYLHAEDVKVKTKSFVSSELHAGAD